MKFYETRTVSRVLPLEKKGFQLLLRLLRRRRKTEKKPLKKAHQLQREGKLVDFLQHMLFTTQWAQKFKITSNPRFCLFSSISF